MQTRRTLAIAAVALLSLSAAGLMSTTLGHHDQRVDQRIVHPYNQQVYWHEPIVAGYQVVPPPPMCPGGDVDLPITIYAEDFEEGLNGWEFVGTTLSSRSMLPLDHSANNNLWTLTDWGGTRGTDAGYEGKNRLYFGLTEGPRAGTFNNGHSAGAAQSPWIELPLGPSMLTYADKFEMEYLVGYDHMFVELLDRDGNIHLVCHNNSEGRADEAGVNGGSAYQSCSPFLAHPCLTLLPEVAVGGEPLTGDHYPAWHHRHVHIPPTLWGEEVKIRFTFDTSDSAANWFHGWSVTDVRVTSAQDLL